MGKFEVRCFLETVSKINSYRKLTPLCIQAGARGGARGGGSVSLVLYRRCGRRSRRGREFQLHRSHVGRRCQRTLRPIECQMPTSLPHAPCSSFSLAAPERKPVIPKACRVGVRLGRGHRHRDPRIPDFQDRRRDPNHPERKEQKRLHVQKFTVRSHGKGLLGYTATSSSFFKINHQTVSFPRCGLRSWSKESEKISKHL